MRNVTRKKVRMVLAVRAGAVKQIVPARLFGTKENPLVAERRKFAGMRVMEGMKRKRVSRNSKRPPTPCALTGVHLCTPLTANLNNGRVSQCHGASGKFTKTTQMVTIGVRTGRSRVGGPSSESKDQW